MEEDKKEHLGTLLVQAEIITQNDLATALKKAESTGKRLGQVLIDEEMASEEEITNFLSIQLGYPHIKLEHTFIDGDVAQLITEMFARRHGLLPLYRADTPNRKVIVVAMTDPANLVVHDEVKNALGSEIFVTLATQREMSRFIDRIWGSTRRAADIEMASEDKGRAGVIVDTEELRPSLAKILQMLFNRCLALDASAIHLEPKKRFVAVRLKIHGVFHTITSLPIDTYASVLSRIKILANIELGESLIHLEEGRFHIRENLTTPPIDVRVTVIPAVFGEKVIMKFTRRENIIRPLDSLGFEGNQLDSLREILEYGQGLILISGKNDSGKTTMAYSLLAELEEPSKMVVTIEDPPAYPVSNFNQITKMDSSGNERMSWAETIRAVERQEPHVAYLAAADSSDEMNVMLRLSATGRHVLTSIYADDATSSHWVPFQLGADPHAVASSLRGVVFCMLTRSLCPTCRVETEPDLGRFAARGWPAAQIKGQRFFEAVGCDSCNDTGYRGRVGVYEVMKIHDHIKRMIETKTASAVVRQAALESGMMPLKEAALAKAVRGEISLSDLLTRFN